MSSRGREPDLYRSTPWCRRRAADLSRRLPALKPYSRPQYGNFTNKIPRLVRACATSVLGVLVVSALLKNKVPYLSNAAILVSFVTVTALVLLERALMFQLEIVMARRADPYNRALIVGAGEDTVRLIEAFASDPRLRTRAVGVLTVGDETPHPAIPPDLICGGYDMLEQAIQEQRIDQLILTGHDLPRQQLVELIPANSTSCASTWCPTFRLLTSQLEFNHITGIPLLASAAGRRQGLEPHPQAYLRYRGLARRPAGLHPHMGVAAR